MPSIVQEIAAKLAARQLTRKWHNRVAPKHQKILQELRQAWADGKFGTACRPASRVISEILRSRGIADVGLHGVEAWLSEKQS